MPGYEVRFQRVGVAGGADLLVRSLLDNQQFADPLGEAEALGISPACWPLFGLVWPSARKLADAMQSCRLDGRRVLEIGCGLGLASMVAHRRGADVTASDYHPLTERFLDANIELNLLPPMRYCTGDWGRENPALGEYDLIVGSDVLYERDQPLQLADFVQRHAARQAEVLIVDPNRGNRSAFNRRMRELGFEKSETPLCDALDDGTPYRGRLLRYLRAA